MPSENVYVVTCYHSSDDNETTDVLRIFKSHRRANEYALAYLTEEYGDEWDEYDESIGNDGLASVHATGGENDVFDIDVSAHKLH